jgi:hypothetical protein
VSRPDPIEQREIVAEAVFFALFRVVEIDELSGAEKALEWARAMVDEQELRRGFSEGVLNAREQRLERSGPEPQAP